MTAVALPLQTGTSAARLRMALVRLARTLRRHGDPGLSPSQISALATVEEFGPMRISALATYEAMGAPAATRVVATLEELNLFERRDDPDDKRASVVDLSDLGRATLAKLWNERTIGLSSRLERLSAKERATIDAALPALEKLVRDN
ncbi:MAG TPA: MarR family transcriptional regulator [Acidimicrobiales bacterium]|jgi:DNA-binding MarR family transcriptional regulator|nr:MarR family transcriptional regulator [Acidimicrobiales bacterium]